MLGWYLQLVMLSCCLLAGLLTFWLGMLSGLEQGGLPAQQLQRAGKRSAAHVLTSNDPGVCVTCVCRSRARVSW
jgi:hypothetical protein